MGEDDALDQLAALLRQHEQIPTEDLVDVLKVVEAHFRRVRAEVRDELLEQAQRMRQEGRVADGSKLEFAAGYVRINRHIDKTGDRP